MSEEKTTLDLTPEEQTAEAEATKEVNEDEIREKIASDLGISPDDDKDLLDKLVAREKSQREKLSGAIKQKISWREKAKQTSEKSKDTPEKGKTQKQGQETPNIDELVDQKLNERLEARELEDLELSDELKEEVKKLAKLNGISVRKAAQDPYIKYKIEAVEKEKRILDATPKRNGRGSYQTSYDPSKPLNPEDFDLSTKEGRNSWNDAKAARHKHTDKK
jgi:hypothetical protein